MTNIRDARNALVRRILKGTGKASLPERWAAFNNSNVAQPLGALVEKVAMHANTVTSEDITVAKASGFSEDQVFEIAVCAAVGQATRQYNAAIAALETAARKD